MRDGLHLCGLATMDTGVTNQGSEDKYKMINLFSFNQNTETNRKQIIK